MTLSQHYCENLHFLLPSPRPQHVRNGFLKSAPFSESKMFIKPFGLRCLIKHELASGLLPFTVVHYNRDCITFQIVLLCIE